MTDDDKVAMVARIAAAYNVPVQILTMNDREFHHWLHNTDEGRAILAADAQEDQS